MINFLKTEKGTPFILLPDYYSRMSPLKVFFMFPTEKYNEISFFPRIIVTDDMENINKYQTLEDFRNQQILSGIGNDGIIFINDIYELKPFNEKQLKYYDEIYLYIKENENRFNKALKWYFPLGEIKNIVNSSYFRFLKKTPILGKFMFNINIWGMFLLGFFKYLIIYPIVFMKDLGKLTFDKYINYKRKAIDLNSAETYHSDFLARCMNTPEEELNKIIDERNRKYEEAKKEYLNSNIAFLTILLSFFIFVIPNFVANHKNNEINKLYHENIDLNKEIKNMSNEINRLKDIEIRYDIFVQIEKLKNENKYLIEKIQSGNSEFEDSLKVLEMKINELEKFIQEFEINLR